MAVDRLFKPSLTLSFLCVSSSTYVLLEVSGMVLTGESVMARSLPEGAHNLEQTDIRITKITQCYPKLRGI